MTDPTRRIDKAEWPIRLRKPGECVPDDLAAETTPSQRFHMVAMLTSRMIEIGAFHVVTYSRRNMPVSIIRRA